MHGFTHSDTMFSVRTLPWHGLGKVVEEAPNSLEAIKLAGLDWEVQLNKLYLADGTEMPNARAVCRDTVPLGIVSESYRPVQNTESFAFMDSLVGDDVGYDTAGCLFGGRRVFMTARMKKEWSVDGDEMSLYLLLSNGHTGGNALKVCVTPVRVVCYNTLQCAIHQARNTWSVRHYTNISTRIEEARHTLLLASNYMDAFELEANRLLNVKVSQSDVGKIVETILRKPSEDCKPRESSMFESRLAKLNACLRADDLSNFHDSTHWNAWGLINAFSDYETHSRIRSRQSLLGRVLNGAMPMTEWAREMAMSFAI